MQISVNLNQPWSEVGYYYGMEPEILAKLREKIKGGLAGFDFFSLNCGELCQLIDGKMPNKLIEMAEKLNVKNYCKLLNSIHDGLKGLQTFCEKTDPPATAMQRRAATGLMETTPEEAILLAVKSFYNLHSLEEAQKLTVYEYMIARKSEFNRITAEYNMQRIIEMSHK